MCVVACSMARSWNLFTQTITLKEQKYKLCYVYEMGYLISILHSHVSVCIACFFSDTWYFCLCIDTLLRYLHTKFHHIWGVHGNKENLINVDLFFFHTINYIRHLNILNVPSQLGYTFMICDIGRFIGVIWKVISSWLNIEKQPKRLYPLNVGWLLRYLKKIYF